LGLAVKRDPGCEPVESKPSLCLVAVEFHRRWVLHLRQKTEVRRAAGRWSVNDRGVLPGRFSPDDVAGLHRTDGSGLCAAEAGVLRIAMRIGDRPRTAVVPPQDEGDGHELQDH